MPQNNCHPKKAILYQIHYLHLYGWNKQNKAKLSTACDLKGHFQEDFISMSVLALVVLD